MKLARNIPARIGTGARALALTCSTVIGSTVIGSIVIGGAAPARAATLAPAGQTPAEAMAAWVSGPGYTYLTATEAAESARDGAALARAATLAAEHPQPADTAAYVAMMGVYAAAGEALARGETATANADLARADDMAWDVIEATFGALTRVRVSG